MHNSSLNREDKLSFPSIRGLAYDGKYLILGPANFGVWLFDIHSRQYRRPTYANEETKKNINYQLLDAPLLDISATFIRTQLKEKKGIKYLLPHGVYEEIESNKYYL